MTALAPSSHYPVSGVLDGNMVQELSGYDAMFPMRQGASGFHNMNLGGFPGYGSASGAGPYSSSSNQQAMQYGHADYGVYNQDGSGNPSSCAWSMHTSTSTTPPSRPSSNILESPHDWPPPTQFIGNVTFQGPSSQMGQQSAISNSPYQHYRSGSLPTMPSEYAPVSSTPGSSGLAPSLTPSPTPSGMMGGSPPGGGSVNRQTSRAPYDWMKKASYPNTPTTGESSTRKTRTKDKYRVVYTDHQRLELEKEFHYSRYITIRRKAELAQALALSERQVKIWFQNRRAKERKQNKKREEVMGIKTEPIQIMPLQGGAPHGQGHPSQGHHPGHPGVGAQDPLGAVLQPHTPPMGQQQATHSPPMAGQHS